MKRFQDKGESYFSFLSSRIVCCPNCGKPVDLANDRLSCLKCGYNKMFKAVGTEAFRVLDTGLEIKYFLEIDCSGHTLTAINVEHLEFLESYVEATLRERTPNVNKSLASRLPDWIKDAKNRDSVLKCLKKLRDKLNQSGYFKQS